jgi:DDE family transposase
LTTHEITTREQAQQIVAWYRVRWIIEQVFRSMKSDCLWIRDSQLEDANCFTKLAIAGLIAAIRSVRARGGPTIHDLRGSEIRWHGQRAIAYP